MNWGGLKDAVSLGGGVENARAEMRVAGGAANKMRVNYPSCSGTSDK